MNNKKEEIIDRIIKCSAINSLYLEVPLAVMNDFEKALRIKLSKSLDSYLAWKIEEVKDLVVKQTNIARSENQPTSRLTELYMQLTKLTIKTEK